MLFYRTLSIYSSSINISQCGIYYTLDCSLGGQNRFYGIFGGDHTPHINYKKDPPPPKSSSFSPPYTQSSSSSPCSSSSSFLSFLPPQPSISPSKYSYAIKQVLPSKRPIRRVIDPTLGNNDTAAIC